MLYGTKVFSSPSLGNIRFSYTDTNFYKKKTNKVPKNKPDTHLDYKELFKYYYKNKVEDKNIKDSHHEINKYYLECQKNVKNYFLNDNNKFGLRFEGNKKLENYSLNKFNNIFNKACSAREKILQNQMLNYYYPKDNNDKLMGEKMKLTPIPSKRFDFMKNENEKNEYLKAKRSAVCMRRLEYTHGLKKNNSQEFGRTNNKNINNSIDFWSILKGAVLIIEDWWLKILNKRDKYFENDNDEYYFINNLTEKDSTNSIEKNILDNLNNYNDNNQYIIDDWLSKQTRRMIKKNEQNNNFINDNNIYSIGNNKKLVNLKSKHNYKNRANNNIIVLNSKNNSANLFKSNRRYKNNDKIKDINNKKNHKNRQQNPIKIIQKSNASQLEYKTNVQTIISPSNYLQNYFKDYCLHNNGKNNNNTCSHRDLKSFEFIQNKYHKNKYLSPSISNNDINIDFNIDADADGDADTNVNMINQDGLDNNVKKDEIIIQEINNIEEKKDPARNILRSHKSKSQNHLNNNKRNEKNKNKVKKDLSSEIEPIREDDMINILHNDNLYTYDNKTKKYIIKYNIIKNEHHDNNNQISERSSMDGSIDEIITKRLKDIHNNNEKYAQRILKAYNQVKFYKSYSVEKGKFFNNNQMNTFKSANFFKNH